MTQIAQNSNRATSVTARCDLRFPDSVAPHGELTGFVVDPRYAVSERAAAISQRQRTLVRAQCFGYLGATGVR